MIKRGIIVSIQGYHYKTITELAVEAVNGGCVGLRIDKHIDLPEDKKVPIIGLKKIHVDDPKLEAYITPTVDDVETIKDWCNLVAIDYRRCNKHLNSVSKFCREHHLEVVADIETFEDYERIKECEYYYTYIATTFSVFTAQYRPNLGLVERLAKVEKNLIAEGNFTSRTDVRQAFKHGVWAVCIGGAISNVYKLTQKFVSAQT